MLVTVKPSEEYPGAEIIFEYAGHTFCTNLPLAEVEDLATDLEQVSQIIRERSVK